MRVEPRGEIALLRLEAGKANAFGRALIAHLVGLLDELVGSGARGLVITGYERFFSAGLALPELIELPRTEMRAFIRSFDDLMARIFALPLPVVAAINGHAIAGGCVLALQADERHIADARCKIGLSEAQLGLGLPAIVVETLRAAVPVGSLRRLALEGALVEPAEALALGLVDRVVAPGELENSAVERARALASAPGAGFAHIKSALRAPYLARARAIEEAEADRWLDTWFDSETQGRLRDAVARLGA